MTPPTDPSDLGKAIQDVTEFSQKLIHEEIELAKAEFTEGLTKIAKGAAVGAAAGIFVFFALIYLLESLAWGLWHAVGSSTNYWQGFLMVAVILLILAGVAAFLAVKFLKKANPTPKMAIEEAQKTRKTISQAGAKD